MIVRLTVFILFTTSFFAFAQKAIISTTDSLTHKMPDSLQATMPDTVAISGVLTLEDLRFYQSDALPISFLGRGRFTTTAYRGMPPGFLQFNYGGFNLKNPTTGIWNEHWLPFYQIWDRHQPFGSITEFLAPAEPVGKKAISRIVFSQDYITNISFLDLNFSQRINKTDYVNLSGNIFTGDGSDFNDYSDFNLNTYRAQYHRQLTRKWQLDVFYWQMRHDFHLTPLPLSFEFGEFKQIGNIAWLNFYGANSAKDSVFSQISYSKIEDKYSTHHNNHRWNNQHKISGLMKYFRTLGNWQLGSSAEGEFLTLNSMTTLLDNPQEAFGKVGGVIQFDNQRTYFSINSKAIYHSKIGAGVSAEAVLTKKFGQFTQVGMSAFFTPEAPPLFWRAIEDDTIPQYKNQSYMVKQGVSSKLSINISEKIQVQIEPFFYQMTDYPVYASPRSSALIGWEAQNIYNYGARVTSDWQFGQLNIHNDFTYNHRYQNSFAPQINNITTLKSSVRWFNNALKIDGILTWHYLGYFNIIEYDRLLNQYWQTDLETGPFYIGDFRLQTHFRDAVIYFTWENFLSQDYLIITPEIEHLLIFRLGIDWILFN